MRTLVDTGASDNFIDIGLFSFLPSPLLSSLSPPVPLTLFDGSASPSGPITHAFHHSLRFDTGLERPSASYVTTLHPGIELVLGFSWLVTYKPLVDWASRRLVFNVTPDDSVVPRATSAGATPCCTKTVDDNNDIVDSDNSSECYENVSRSVPVTSECAVKEINDVRAADVVDVSSDTADDVSAMAHVAPVSAAVSNVSSTAKSICQTKKVTIINETTDADPPADAHEELLRSIYLTSDDAQDEPEDEPAGGRPSVALIGSAAFALLRDRGEQVFCATYGQLEDAERDLRRGDDEIKLEEHVPEAYRDFADVFSDVEADALPPHREHDHSIDIEPGKTPPCEPIYSLSLTELAEAKRYIDENLRKGFIRPSTSSAGAPILFAKKKDGSLRLCVDYRGLNRITRKNRYPLPLVGDLLDRLKDARVFSKIDLRSGYYNVRMKEGDEWKTAFRTRHGSFEYLVMPFGLTNAPSSFQNFMNDLFNDMTDEFVVIYLDDILVFSKDPAQHEEHVRRVLQRLRDSNLHAKPEKCEFHTTSVEYLGFLVTPEGVKMDETKSRAVDEWPRPRTVKEVQRFLGFCNFYRRFIDHYSSIASPLHNLTRIKQKGRIPWTDESERAFAALKRAFMQAPVLHHYQPDRPIVVETDCSDYALGGILSQVDERTNDIVPVAFYSRKLQPAEVNYDIYDKELLGIVDSFKEWRHYLEGARHRIQIFTDHRNLQHFREKRVLNRRQVRWSQFLEEFDFNINYRPGRLGEKPDALTRHAGVYPYSRDEVSERKGKGVEELMFKHGQLLAALVLDFAVLTSLIKQGMLHDTDAQRRVAELQPDDPRSQMDESGQLLVDGRVFVPDFENLRLRITQAFHDHHLAGHPGVRRTLSRIRERYWWPQMTPYVKQFVRSCDVCARTKAVRHKPYGPMRFLPVPERPWTSISMDFIEGLPLSRGHDAILVVVDRLSKMALFIPTFKDLDTPDLVRLFLDRVFSKHGAPHDIVSDRGRHFVSKLWSGICAALRIKSNLSTAYHPETDGQTERVNQILEQYVRVYTNYQQDDWVDLLPLAEYTYNSSPHEATGVTPFFANKGYHPQLTADVDTLLPGTAKAIASNLDETHAFLREALSRTRDRYTRSTEDRRVPSPSFAVGTKVWLDARDIATKRPMKKLDNRRLGPFEVIAIVSPNARRLKLPHALRFIHNVFNVRSLEPYTDNPFDGRVQVPPPPIEVDGSDEYEVEEILDSKFDKRRRAGEDLIYTVKWVGHSDPTFEPEAHLENAQSLVQDFHARYPALPGPHNRPRPAGTRGRR